MNIYHLNYSKPYDLVDFVVAASNIHDAIGLAQVEESVMDWKPEEWELNTFQQLEGVTATGKPRVLLCFEHLG